MVIVILQPPPAPPLLSIYDSIPIPTISAEFEKVCIHPKSTPHDDHDQKGQ